MRRKDERAEPTQDTGEFPELAPGETSSAWGGPAAAAAPAGPKARSGLVLLIAFAVQAVIIAALGNQYVANKIADTRPSSLMMTGLRNVALVYSWRVSPRGGHDVAHLWLAATIALPVAVVLSLLLILTVIRGPVTFWRALFGTWMAVAVSAMLGGYVRGLIVDRGFGAAGGVRPSRPEQALFGPLAPGSIVFLAGVALGLVVAIVVAIVARVTRRDPVVLPAGVPAEPVPDDPHAPPPYYGDRPADAPGAPWQDARYGPPARATDPTDQDDRRTTALPSLHKEQREHEEPTQRAEGATTTQLPPVGPDHRTEPVADVPGADVPGADVPGADRRAAADDPADRAPVRSEPEATQAMPISREAEPTAPQSEPTAPQSEPTAQRAVEHPAEPADQRAAVPAAEPAGDHTAQQTTQLPRVREEPAQTARFPRPPDDEDLEPERP